MAEVIKGNIPESTFTVASDRGVVVMPVKEYEEIRSQIEDMLHKIGDLEKYNHDLRTLYAALKLPNPDSIDGETVETEEFYGLYHNRRQRRITFTYDPTFYE